MKKAKMHCSKKRFEKYLLIMYSHRFQEALGKKKALAKKSSLCFLSNSQFPLLLGKKSELTVWMNAQQGAFDVDIR